LAPKIPPPLENTTVVSDFGKLCCSPHLNVFLEIANLFTFYVKVSTQPFEMSKSVEETYKRKTEIEHVLSRSAIDSLKASVFCKNK
jgi:hypothetical protein